MIECNAHRWSSRICSWGRRNRLLPRGDVYRQQGCAVGFGEATHQMRAALRDNGLELAQAGRQYEDHMGIELLLASELCRRAGEGEDWGADAGCVPSAASEGRGCEYAKRPECGAAYCRLRAHPPAFLDASLARSGRT